jgi:DME family drug/metabolite transporter|tara:strand:+ start:15523 stop:16380 length:858 start_codon:yes stop_codon:yes gene_type:complete
VLRDRLNVVIGGVLFSTGGVAIKAATLTGWQLSCFRSFIAGVAVLLLVPNARHGWSWRSLVVAVPYAATFTLFTLANKLTTAANAIFLQDTAPFYILLLGPLLLGERIRRNDIALMLALIIGLGLIFNSIQNSSEIATNPELGNLLATCAGLSWALTVIGLRWIAIRSKKHKEQPEAAVVTGCFLASLMAVFFSFPIESSTTVDWLIIFYLGVFQIGLAYSLIAKGIRSISALETSLLLLVEPVFSPIWAWLLLAENPGFLSILGGSLVISATAIHSFQKTMKNH